MVRENKPQRPEGRPDPKAIFATLATVIAGILYVIIYFANERHSYIAWLAAWSGATFILYGFDKFQAPREGWRVPKVVLHGLSLIGGFLGGWAGMFVFRHKVRHLDFWAVLLLSTLIHTGLVYLFTQFLH